MAGEAVSQRMSESCCKGSFIIEIIFALIWTAISIAFIVVGSIHLHDCPAEHYIPIYMIVAGCFTLAYWLFLPLECFAPTLRKILNVLIGLFLFAWFIAGSVWVFRIYDEPDRTRRCHNGMYLFVFSILIIQYILIGIGIIASILSCLCCENSCFSKMCSCFNCAESCGCGESCGGCGESCGCGQSCGCSSCCKSIQCGSCLKSCCCCGNCCQCLQCGIDKA